MDYRLRLATGSLALILAAAMAATTAAATLGIDAELYDSVTGTTWQVVDTTPTYTSPQGLPILPVDTNALRAEALLANFSGSTGIASYDLSFSTPGTYYLYLRYSMYDSTNSVGSYGNEDSIIITSAFGTPLDTSTDIYDFSTQGNGTPGTGYWDGIFHWQQVRIRGASADLAYTITPSDIGQVMTLQVQNRERGAVLDYFLLSTEDNLTERQLNGLVPEPSTLALLATGVLALLGLALRKRRRSRA